MRALGIVGKLTYVARRIRGATWGRANDRLPLALLLLSAVLFALAVTIIYVPVGGLSAMYYFPLGATSRLERLLDRMENTTDYRFVEEVYAYDESNNVDPRRIGYDYLVFSASGSYDAVNKTLQKEIRTIVPPFRTITSGDVHFYIDPADGLPQHFAYELDGRGGVLDGRSFRNPLAYINYILGHARGTETVQRRLLDGVDVYEITQTDTVTRDLERSNHTLILFFDAADSKILEARVRISHDGPICFSLAGVCPAIEEYAYRKITHIRFLDVGDAPEAWWPHRLQIVPAPELDTHSSAMVPFSISYPGSWRRILTTYDGRTAWYDHPLRNGPNLEIHVDILTAEMFRGPWCWTTYFSEELEESTQAADGASECADVVRFSDALAAGTATIQDYLDIWESERRYSWPRNTLVWRSNEVRLPMLSRHAVTSDYGTEGELITYHDESKTIRRLAYFFPVNLPDDAQCDASASPHCRSSTALTWNLPVYAQCDAAYGCYAFVNVVYSGDTKSLDLIDGPIEQSLMSARILWPPSESP